MPEPPFNYGVFLSHSAKDKQAVPVPNGVRPLAERLRADGLKVWFDQWVLEPGDQNPVSGSSRRGSAQTSGHPDERVSGLTSAATREEMIEEGLEHSRVLVLCMSANAFGSDWAQLEAGTCGRGNLPFRDSLNRERRFLPLGLDDAPIKGSNSRT